jgi:hypothetical protein
MNMKGADIMADIHIDIDQGYRQQLDKLRGTIRSPKNFEAAIRLTLDLHAITHSGGVSGSNAPTYYDSLLEGLTDADYSVMPTKKDETIAWHIWHIARIEDMVGNLLIAERAQIFDDAWMKRLNVGVKDTGNVMTDEEIFDLSSRVGKRELIAYRDEVGRGTRKIIAALAPEDLRRKPREEYLNRLAGEGGLLEQKKSIWLRDFWGRYTVAGLLMLPLTYHHMLHLPDSMAIKRFLGK